MKTRSPWVAALAVLALVSGGLPLVGCGGSDAGQATTSTAPWTKQEAGKQYLAGVARLNRYINAWEDKKITPQNVREYAKGLTVREDAWVRQMADGRWPANVRADINRLIRAVNSGRRGYVDVYTAKSGIEAMAAWDRIGGNGGTAAAADVRTRLGLPPPPD
jgi:hypothetical protein